MAASFVNRLFSFAFPESFITAPEIRAFINDGRNPFSRYLPYLAYHPELKLYLNADDTAGFIFLCHPLWAEADESRTQIQALVEDLPEGGVLSFHMISFDYLEDVLEEYVQSKKARKNPLIDEIAENYARFLKNCTDGIPHFLGTPLRRFLLLISVKFTETDPEFLRNYRQSLAEQLRACGLSPVPLEPELLIKILFKLLNDRYFDLSWDMLKPIRDQIILSDTEIQFDWKRVKTGEKLWACITPKSLPPEFDSSAIGDLIGPADGPQSDGRQILSHFVFTTIVYKDPSLHGDLRKKAGLFFNQIKGEAHKSIIGKLIGEYAKEHSEAVEDIERGETFYYIYPLFWVFDRDEKKLSQSVQRIKSLFQSKGFITQEERGILPVLFLMGFPFGFSLKGREIAALDRHFIGKKELVSALVPVVGDISGTEKPSCIFISRKGQLVPFDPWTEGVANKHCLVAGATGGGKSLNMNLIVLSLYASGALVRIVDLGYSYEKLCKALGGTFIDFDDEHPLCLNPFTYVTGENQDEINGALDSIKELILTMIFMNDRKSITKDHENLVKEAVYYAWRQIGNEATIGMVYEWLATFPAYASVEDICDMPKSEELSPEEKKKIATQNACLMDLKIEAQKMAYALKVWTEDGPYGRWFNGRANVDLVSGDFIVLELERLRRVEPLLRVVGQAVITAATASMYLSDREKRKLFLFEECGVILKNNPALKATVEEMYRRARKYNGAVVTVFQSAMDLKDLGDAAHVISGNSSYHFYLPDNQLDQAKQLMGADDYLVRIARSVKLVKPRYGEIALRTPWGAGVVRTLLNGELYYLVTTDADDWTKIQKLVGKKVEKGMDKQTALIEAIKELGAERDEFFEKRFSN